MVWIDYAVKRLQVSGGDYGGWMDAETTEIANDETFELSCLEIETSEGVLGMSFEGDSISDY